MSGKLKLYGDPISGNCLKAKWVADYLGLDYEWIALNILKGETRTPSFLAVNPFGQIPTAVLPDGGVLTQSNAIALHLAQSENSDLLPSDAYLRAQVFQWMFWEQNSHEPYIAGRRFRKAFLGQADALIDPEWMPRGEAALALMERHLENADYFVGNHLTLADIVLVAYTRVAPAGGFSLDNYAGVRSWIARVERALDVEPITEIN